jgi:hypothetical protein
MAFVARQYVSNIVIKAMHCVVKRQRSIAAKAEDMSHAKRVEQLNQSLGSTERIVANTSFE